MNKKEPLWAVLSCTHAIAGRWFAGNGEAPFAIFQLGVGDLQECVQNSPQEYTLHQKENHQVSDIIS
jgi:hypothetical protein